MIIKFKLNTLLAISTALQLKSTLPSFVSNKSAGEFDVVVNVLGEHDASVLSVMLVSLYASAEYSPTRPFLLAGYRVVVDRVFPSRVYELLADPGVEPMTFG